MCADKTAPRTELTGTGISLFRPRQHLPRPDAVLRQLPALPAPARPAINTARVWESLGPVTLAPDPAHAKALFVNSSDHPAAAAFDILRTRLLQDLAKRGWRRVAITSPTHGCGKSFVAANLALSLARRPASRTVLVDLDLRHPDLARVLGIAEDRALDEFLSGDQPLESLFRRFGRNLALGLNGEAIETASETLHDPETALALADVVEQLDPEVVLYDLPPLLGSDDVLALAPCIDAVMLVADGSQTSPRDMRAAEAALEGRLHLLGVVLNRAQDGGRYRYAKG